jgi:hypothetical protein
MRMQCCCCCAYITVSSSSCDLLLVEKAKIHAVPKPLQQSHLEQLCVRLAAGHEGGVQRVGWQWHIIRVLRLT